MTDADEPAQVALTAGVLRGWPVEVGAGTKDARGRLLVVGGSAMTPGSVLLAAEAALRGGAAKLQIATVRSVAAPLGVALPEAMVAPLPEDDTGQVSPAAAPRIVELAEQADTVLLGPGMSAARTAVAVLNDVVPRLTATVVLDALAMAYLTDNLSGVRHLGGRVILSPNTKEMARTLGEPPEDCEADPQRYARRLAREAGAVVVSGTGTTWVCRQDGPAWYDDSGVGGLGTSGSGDVKAGVIAGLTLRTAELVHAAAWGVVVHSRASERLAVRVGSMGFLARELLGEIPAVLTELRSA